MNRPLRILIIDTNSKDVERIETELLKAGLNASFAQASCRDELNDLLVQQTWDILLTECRVNDLTAQDVVAMLQRHVITVPVIVVCRGVGEGLAVSLMHAGAHDFVSKKDLSRLAPAIERELAEQAQHRQAEHALHETKQRFLQLSRNIEEVFWLLDAEAKKVLYLSPSFEEMWEQSATQMLSSPQFLLATIHPDDVPRIQQLLDEQGWLAFNHDYRIVLGDGSVRWIHTRCFSLQDELDGTGRIAGISTDITGKKELEQERDMMTRALEQSADAVMITDTEGTIIYVNATFEDISGYSKQEALGRKPSLLRSGFQDNEFYHRVWQSLKNGIPFVDVFINRRKDGELYYEAKTITPLRSSEGELTHFVSTGMDITAHLKGRDRLHRILHYDVVTGLANQALLHERLHREVLHAHRLEQRLGVICLGLGLAQLLGSSVGHELYEQMMRVAAWRMQESLEPHITLARLNGDEFVILLKELEYDGHLEAVLQQLRQAFATPLQVEGYELFLLPSVGVSVYPDHALEADELLQQARLAMHYARQHSSDDFVYYRQDMRVLPNTHTN